MGSSYIFPWWTEVSFAFLTAYVPFYIFVLNIICFALADGNAIACLDVLQITHAAISLVNLMFETHKIHDRGSYFIGYFEEENAVVIQCVVHAIR